MHEIAIMWTMWRDPVFSVVVGTVGALTINFEKYVIEIGIDAI